MKLRPLGRNMAELVEGVILTPEEYLAHPSYTKFGVMESTRLFVTFDGRTWSRVQPDMATHFALLEATEEEQVRLKANGYKMLNLE